MLSPAEYMLIRRGSMARPQKDRIVAFNPDVSYFKPRGIPLLKLDEVGLTVDERTWIRLGLKDCDETRGLWAHAFD